MINCCPTLLWMLNTGSHPSIDSLQRPSKKSLKIVVATLFQLLHQGNMDSSWSFPGNTKFGFSIFVKEYLNCISFTLFGIQFSS